MPLKAASEVPRLQPLPGVDLTQYDVVYASNPTGHTSYHGPGGCVSFVKSATGVYNSANNDWYAIARVLDHPGSTLYGLAIMTAEDGRYRNTGDLDQHAAICLSVSGSSIEVRDHITVSGGRVRVSNRTIGPAGNGARNRSGWYYVVGIPRTITARVGPRTTSGTQNREDTGVTSPSPAPRPASQWTSPIAFAPDMASRQKEVEPTVRYTLAKLGYSPDRAGLQQFQSNNGLPQGPMDQATYYKLYSREPVRGAPPSPSAPRAQVPPPSGTPGGGGYQPAQPLQPPPRPAAGAGNLYAWLPPGYPQTHEGAQMYIAHLKSGGR
jgi:hypothetical protein